MTKDPKETKQPHLTAHFEAAFSEHWSGILRLLVRLVGDSDAAEDLALETFYRLANQPEDKQQSDYMGAWLYRVATNLGLNALRDWKRRESFERRAGQISWFENHSQGPAEIFMAEEDRRRVRRVLGEMNPKQAQLLVLRHSGQSYKQIAATLGLAPTSIGPLLVRAERDFKKRFCREEQEQL
jgi:RNA polymerase sigma-70 factor, ECF subfamily